MNGHDFLRIVNSAFAPFLRELGFSMDPPSVSGRLYRASFTGAAHAVSVSFEPGEDALFVVVFTRENGQLSDMDDRTRSPRLADLSARYGNTVTVDKRARSEAAFNAVVARDREEQAVLGAAQELRLVLPKYLARESSR